MQVESGALPQELTNKHCMDAGNPFFSAELVGQVAVVNCQVTAAGLTAQLAAAVVRAEQPTLAAQQSDLVAAIAAGRRQQVHHSWGVLAGGGVADVVTSSKGYTHAYPAALLATLLQFQLVPLHNARRECDYAVAKYGSSSSVAHAYNLTLQGYMQCTYVRVAL